MLNDIDLLNTLPKGVNIFAPQTNDNFCVERTSNSSSPLNFNANQPLRPFSHPSHLCNKDITSYCLEEHVHASVLSYTRPSSTPASNKSLKHAEKKLTDFCPFPITVGYSNQLCGKNPSIEKLELCRSNSFTPSSVTPLKEDSSVDPVVDDLVNSTVPYEVDDRGSLFIAKAFTSTGDNNELYGSKIPTVYDHTQPLDRTSTVRAGVKRPHSTALCYTHYSDGGDPLTRPLSAPKRLIEEMHVSSDLNSILPSPDDTPISSVKFSNTNPDAPKSTLEALVASTSPLTFFPHEFPIDSECDEKFPEFAPQVSNSLMNKNIMNDLSYSVDLTSPNTEFSVKGEVDLNAINSVPPSKSMTSLDLNDLNFKCPNSHGSHKSVYSDLGLITDAIENNDTSAATHMNEYVQAIRTYAAELCPVDCVILLEHCRPFNCDSLFMKYFRDQYLCPILSNLNGGPPLNADFGRDAYTSLYSLHGFCWRKPMQTTTLMPDTPIIYKILKKVATMQHESRHTSDQINPSEGTPGHELLQAAVKEFDAIDRARRGLCKKVQRHLILLAMSPIDISKLSESDSSFIELGDDGSNLNSQEPLRNLRMRGVALSVFSPVRSSSLLKLYELVNGTPVAPFYDRRWQTVALSDKLLESDIPERRIVGPMAAAFHAQTEAELSIIEHKQLFSKQTLTNGHSNRIIEDSHHQSHTSALTTDHSLNNRCVATSNNKYPVQEQNLQQSTYCTETSTYPITSNSSLTIATDGSFRTDSNSCGGNSSSQYANDRLSPMAVTQFCATASPVGSYQRPPRNPSSLAPIQYPPASVPNYSARSVCNSRGGPDNTTTTTNNNNNNVRSVEGIAPLANSLSAGHSGPNSVDQTPGSVYGSDSVATPQGMYASQAGTVSPLQVANNSLPASQLHSPLASGGLHSHQPTPSSIQSSYNAYHHNTSHIYQNQQSLYDQNISKVMPGSAPSPNVLQNSFRPSSNAPSPSSQFIPTTVNTSGLSSPCSSRVPSKQYSPQLTPHQQQGSPQNRLNCPGGTQKPIHSQFIRGNNSSNNQISTSNNHQTNENFTTHSRSNTPTNTVYTNNATINSSPLNNPQYVNYIPKDNLQQHQQQSQMKISSPQSSCLLGGDNNVVQHSSNPPSQSSLTISQQNNRRSHIPANTNISVHQSSQIPQQQSQLCPSRSVFWEGEIHVIDPNGMSMTNRFPLRLLLEQCAVRDVSQINLQMWGPVAQLSIIQAYRDSLLVERLSSPLGNGQLLARLLVDLLDSNDVNNLSALLSTQANQMIIPLGILSPSTYRLSNPIQPGTVGFICLIYNPNRNRIHGFVPYDSEQFRQDIVMGRYTNTRSSNNMTPDLNSNLSGNHFQRVHPNSQTLSQGHVDSAGTMLNINSQYMNTPHMGNNNNIPPRDPSPCNSVNPTYQYQNQSSHIPQYMPQHINSQAQNPSKSQILGNTAYQPIQLNQRSTPSPHNLHDNLQTGATYMPQYPLESETSTQWITNRTDTVSHQNQQPSISNNTIPNQSVRTIQSGQNSHVIQQPVTQRSAISTGYSNTTAYHGHPPSRPNLDRLGAPTPVPVQCNPMTDPSIMLDQTSIHNSPLTNVLSHGQQQPQSQFVPSGSRIQNTLPSNSVNSYHRNIVPQNSGYSQPQSFNQRDHYMATQSQTHLSPGGNIGGGYTCYQSRNNMVANNIPNPSGHRFVPGPPNVGTLQMSNQQSHIVKHQHTPVLSQGENISNRHGTFGHQSAHIRPSLSNINCNTSVDGIGPHYALPSQDLPQHMIHSNLHGSLRQQPSYDSCGPSGGGLNSQGFI